MNTIASGQFSLDLFEGPLSFLLQLIQKNEINVCQIFIKELTRQYTEKAGTYFDLSIEEGAEFISTAALLMWMKSRKLLPQQEIHSIEDQDADPNFEIIYKLLEYSQFKDAAKILKQRESEQECYHSRAQSRVCEGSRRSGFHDLSLEKLAELFQTLLNRACSQELVIHEEPWKVSDKMTVIRKIILKESKVPLMALFSDNRSKIEMVVTFLAMLELMKMGEILVDNEKVYAILPDS